MAAPERIVFLTGRLHRGGSEKILFEHLRALDRSRFSPEVLTLDPNDPGRRAYEAAGIPVFGAPHGRSGLLNVARMAGWIRTRCAEGRVRLLHAWITLTGLLGPVVARLSGIDRVVVSQRNLGYWLTGPRRVVYRRSTRWFVDRLVVNSEAVRAQVLRDRICPGERIRVIYNGVDLDRFRPPGDRAAARESLGLGRSGPVLGIVGSLKAIKGQADLLAAMEILLARGLAAELVVVGEGPDREELSRRAASGGGTGRIRFLGRREDVERVYPALDVCVLCSRTEGFPNVLLEAMACGCAVVTTPVGGIPEAVDEGAEALFYPPGDPEALAGRLEALIRDPDRRALMGRRARERAEDRFGFARMQREFEALYAELLA